MGEWWLLEDSSENMLSGVDDDPENPPRLSASRISAFLTTIPEARESFNRLVVNMLPEEQDRLYAIAEGLPTYLALDYQFIQDHFQHVLNTGEVRTAGPRGGTRCGGNR